MALGILDPETLKAFVIIIIILWVFSGQGFRVARKLLEKAVEDLE